MRVQRVYPVEEKIERELEFGLVIAAGSVTRVRVDVRCRLGDLGEVGVVRRQRVLLGAEGLSLLSLIHI